MREKVLEAMTLLFGDREVDMQSLSDDDDLSIVLGWDSMDVVDMILEMERRWNLRLADDVPNVITLRELVKRAEAAKPTGPAAE